MKDTSNNLEWCSFFRLCSFWRPLTFAAFASCPRHALDAAQWILIFFTASEVPTSFEYGTRCNTSPRNPGLAPLIVSSYKTNGLSHVATRSCFSKTQQGAHIIFIWGCQLCGATGEPIEEAAIATHADACIPWRDRRRASWSRRYYERHKCSCIFLWQMHFATTLYLLSLSLYSCHIISGNCRHNCMRRAQTISRKKIYFTAPKYQFDHFMVN